MTTQSITNDTPIAMLTVGQLKEVLNANASTIEHVPSPVFREKRYVYGLRGIRGLFNIAHSTAQRYKDGILKDAVIQNGRNIIIDVDLAMELFAKNQRGQS